jgi:hypothetical protein
MHDAAKYLEPVFHIDRSEAQDLVHYRSLQTTKDASSHIEAEERAERVSDILDTAASSTDWSIDLDVASAVIQ